MAQRSRLGMNRITPWGGKAAWWIVLAEGIIAVVVGLYVLVQPQQASTWLAQLIGAYVLVNSGLAIYAGFSGSGTPGEQPFRLIAGGIGLVTGLLALSQPLLVTLDTLASFTVLGAGLLLAGVVDLVGLVVGRGSEATHLGRILAGGLHVLLGVLLLYLGHTGTAGNALLLLGVVGIVLGVLLIFYAARLRRRPHRLS